MGYFGQDERGATSVTGLVLLVAVTIIVASTVAVFVFGIDTKDVQDAVDDILDMDDDVESLLPLILTPLSGLRRCRSSDEESTNRAVRSPSD